MKSYLITNPKYYPRFAIAHYAARSYTARFPNFICLRDKGFLGYEREAMRFLRGLRRVRSHLVLHDRFDVALRLRSRGFKFFALHLSGAKFRLISRSARLGITTIVSCRNENEMRSAIKKGAKFVTISPIFATDKSGDTRDLLGVEFLANLPIEILKKTIALGGIATDREIGAIKKTAKAQAKPEAFAFASIRYFTPRRSL
ncbi:MAG: thiamine phosphate synthase [Helicobacteraceae bacterium]|nr:thiamine phosphate synthase [Helicobacteraceae bacterium]